MTDDDVRRRLDSLLADVPGGPLEPPADLTARAVRRSRRRRALVSGVAALAVAGVVGGVVTVAKGTDGARDALVAGSEPTRAALVDVQWLVTGRAPAFPSYVVFLSDGTWRGSDGCNGLGGTWTLADDGGFSTTSGVQTLIGCDNSDVGSWMRDASRLALAPDELSLVAPDGELLGMLRRATVPYDPLTAPPPFAQRAPLPSCGEYLLSTFSTRPPQAPVDCLVSALRDGTGAELAVDVPTGRGESTVTYYRVLPGGDEVEVFADEPDSSGVRSWSRTTCTGFSAGEGLPTGCSATGYYPNASSDD